MSSSPPIDDDLIELYREMVADEEQEREAAEWIEAAVDEGLDLGEG